MNIEMIDAYLVSLISNIESNKKSKNIIAGILFPERIIAEKKTAEHNTEIKKSFFLLL